nr:NADH dehydrogenase subunit 3 [Subulatus sp.]
MNLILMNIMLIIMLMMLMLTLIMIISKKYMLDLQKSSSFECGFNPLSNTRLPFSIHFYIMAVIFLIFDIEIIIIIPMIFLINYSIMLYWIMTAVLFIMILLLGLYHEWYNGLLNWTK